MTARQGGAAIGRITVALRIAGDTVDPEAITRLLGVAPTFAARRGEAVWRRERTLTQRHGVWTHALTESAETGEELDDAIGTLLARFPSDASLWARLAGEHDIGISCGLFLTTENQGSDLRAATLRALADRQLSLSLDVYGVRP